MKGAKWLGTREIFGSARRRGQTLLLLRQVAGQYVGRCTCFFAGVFPMRGAFFSGDMEGDPPSAAPDFGGIPTSAELGLCPTAE